MGKAIGIDLGTTNSVAAFKLAEVEVVTANDNTPPDRKLTRSVVAYEQKKFLVGDFQKIKSPLSRNDNYFIVWGVRGAISL
ncbi:Hsp70 family protein [Nostoc sp.]|uniref:Hsp70 family protein n=1 Tax=Nostoc sp. TaxID=1180 RepID=UPI002FFCDAE3